MSERSNNPRHAEQEGAPKPTTIFVAGVQGTGKSTVGARLAASTHLEQLVGKCSFLDADSFHDLNARKLLSRGKGVDSDYREKWLRWVVGGCWSINRKGQNSICACSLLTRRLRDQVLQDFQAFGGTAVVLFLDCPEAELRARLERRDAIGLHFAKKVLLESQLKTVELPATEEFPMVQSINGVAENPDEVIDRAIQTLRSIRSLE